MIETEMNLSPSDVEQIPILTAVAALESDWAAMVGPELDSPDSEIARLVFGSPGSMLSSGTGALNSDSRTFRLG